MPLLVQVLLAEMQEPRQAGENGQQVSNTTEGDGTADNNCLICDHVGSTRAEAGSKTESRVRSFDSWPCGFPVCQTQFIHTFSKNTM